MILFEKWAKLLIFERFLFEVSFFLCSVTRHTVHLPVGVSKYNLKWLVWLYLHSSECQRNAPLCVRERALGKETKIPFSTLQSYLPKGEESRSIEHVNLVRHYEINILFKNTYRILQKLLYCLTTQDYQKVVYEEAAINKIKMPTVMDCKRYGRYWFVEIFSEAS